MSPLSHEAAYEEACREGQLPGAVLVATDATGKFRYAKAFGETAWGEKLSVDSVMWIASCTKLMTSVAALQQVERGNYRIHNIGLDDDVTSWLPELASLDVLEEFDEDGKPIMKQRIGPITLKHLLTHSSGIAYPFSNPKLQRLAEWDNAYSSGSARSFYGQPLLFQPGHGWAYSTGLGWVGKLIEKLSGLRLEDYMRINIWDPLGMVHVSFDHPEPSPEIRKRKVGMSKRAEEGRVAPTTEGISAKRTSEEDGFYGGGGVWSSAESYLPLLQSLCANDGRVLNRESVEEMFRPQLSAASKAALNQTLKSHSIGARFYANSFSVDKQDFDHGLGGAIGRKDEVGSRTAGTMSWGGLPNLIWWIDRKAGLCGACFTQLLPMGDAQCITLMRLFEKATYERYREFQVEV